MDILKHVREAGGNSIIAFPVGDNIISELFDSWHTPNDVMPPEQMADVCLLMWELYSRLTEAENLPTAPADKMLFAYGVFLNAPAHAAKRDFSAYESQGRYVDTVIERLRKGSIDGQASAHFMYRATHILSNV